MQSNDNLLSPDNNVTCCAPVAENAPQAAAAQGEPVSTEVLVVSDSCCNPAATPLEERAIQTVKDAISATNANADVRLVSATDALAGALPPAVLTEIQTQLQQGGAQPPLVMIDGRVVASGTFAQKDVETALSASS